MALNVDDYTEYDSFEEAMQALAGDMAEVMPWNEWQKFASQLVTSYPDAPRDTKTWSALRKVTMKERFGPDWQKRTAARLKSAVLETVAEESALAEAAATPGTEEAINPRQGTGADAEEQLALSPLFP